MVEHNVTVRHGRVLGFLRGSPLGRWASGSAVRCGALAAVAAFTFVSCAEQEPARKSASTRGMQSKSVPMQSKSAMGEHPKSQGHTFPGTRTVLGTVESIRGEQVEINTGDPQPRYVTVKMREEKGLPSFEVGDRVMVWVNEQNEIVDAHLKGEETAHKILEGKLAQSLTTGHEKAVLKLDDGSEASYAIRPLVRAKVAAVPVGTDAVFLIDESSQIADVSYAAAENSRSGMSSAKNAYARSQGVISSPLEDNRIGLRGEDGKEASYEVRPLMRDKLKGLSKGSEVVLFLDDEQKVTDVAVPPGAR
ncbi:hypothetical protein YTPLAS18_32190 [Nitrospira sp.]|nr:hypothetical protein YTPLAS18_32190 [Nitrospira sp.]